MIQIFKKVIQKIKNKISEYKRNSLWRERNKQNTTFCSPNFPIEQVTVGRGTYGNIQALIFSDELTLKIGAYCSIAPNVSFMVGADHALNNVSTFPYKVQILGEKYEAVSKGNVIISDDVWIGCNSTILSGLTIGQGAVIAAGAVVTKDVPPYAVVAGVPARVIKYRFPKPVIEYLLTFDYSQLTEKLVKEHINELYTPLNSLSLEEIKSVYSWFPKKIL